MPIHHVNRCSLPYNRIQIRLFYTTLSVTLLFMLTTGEPTWWETGLGAPREWVLVQDQPGDHGSPEPGWHEWASSVFFLQAGCYAMDVSWPGGQGWPAGHWRIIFPVGR